MKKQPKWLFLNGDRRILRRAPKKRNGRVAQNSRTTPLASTKRYSDEHLLLKRWLSRQGFALIRTENAILDESLRWRFFVPADLSIFLACGIIMSQIKGG